MSEAELRFLLSVPRELNELNKTLRELLELIKNKNYGDNCSHN